ncbi:response regulator transcription factor [Flavivirga amylovorans]|uniref:Response regulator transcription factor n=1 Tax=Flavivirga amylovorans TaxID=870486 RepID=A0ABT8X1I5_9FLAO|nr:response regulator transcription factor [Flavivirga amylovorans]MDO5987814.1 response regulator transcription factor [Flavivirga amylovorans]
MNKILLFIFLSLISIELNAQTNISGYISIDDSIVDKQLIFLSIKSINSTEESNIITSGQLDKNGFFNINHGLLNENKLYTLSINNNKRSSKSFILSNNDSLFFQKSNTPFTVFTNTNNADKEWQKLKKIIEKQDAGINEIHNYTKDSLKILAIKLLSIKELKNRKLLKKDIYLNPEYYSNLLKELKQSEIDANEYIFLETELEFHNLKSIENKYSISRLINFILGFLLLTLIVYKFSSKLLITKKENYELELSKQELNVKKLILDGKSNKDIAEDLFISLSTVKTHITNIYNKLNVSNRSELIAKFKN